MGEEAPEVEDRAKREEEKRRRREVMAKAWQKMQVCLPQELQESL